MAAPPGMENCVDVHAFKGTYPNGEAVTITCWKPTPEDLVRINLGESVWLHIVGDVMPPAAVMTENPFEGLTTDAHG